MRNKEVLMIAFFSSNVNIYFKIYLVFQISLIRFGHEIKEKKNEKPKL